MNHPRVVGVAGPYCAGKNTLLPFFVKRGYTVIDLDRLGHQVLEEIKDRLVGLFGPSIVGPDGGVDRRRVGRLVFRDPARLHRLEALLHPEMKLRVTRELSANPSLRYVLNAAVLFTMGLDRLCDVVVWVTSPWWIRWIRGINRDHLGPFQTFLRVRAVKVPVQVRRPHADIIVVDNRGPLEAVFRRLDEEWERRYG